MRSHRIVIVAVILLTVYGHGISAYGQVDQGAEFFGLGFLPGFFLDWDTSAPGVSGDGSVVVGTAVHRVLNRALPIRWTRELGLHEIPQFRGVSSIGQAFAISRDGTTVVGQARFAGGDGFSALKWSQAEGTVDLGAITGMSPNGSAFDVSPDGSIVVGRVDLPLPPGELLSLGAFICPRSLLG